jgi:hypothetical protein
MTGATSSVPCPITSNDAGEIARTRQVQPRARHFAVLAHLRSVLGPEAPVPVTPVLDGGETLAFGLRERSGHGAEQHKLLPHRSGKPQHAQVDR